MKKDIFFKSICYVDGSVHGLRSNVLNWSWFATLYLDDSVKVLHNFCGGFFNPSWKYIIKGNEGN